MIAAQNAPSQTFPGIQLEQKQNGTKAGHTERYTKAGHTERYKWLATRQVAAAASFSNGRANLYVVQIQAYRGQLRKGKQSKCFATQTTSFFRSFSSLNLSEVLKIQ
jgi:hypothetical protein